ncbi:MAG: endolytic transglycosylase MltG, partial [Rhodocyclaceae bacterium]|nr:endolytic transglycosylase MltG [Rhodocyclaceae bacterium]
MSTPDAPKKPAAARTAKKRKPAAQPDTRQQSLFTEEAAPVAPKKPAARASAGKSAARADAKAATKPVAKPAAKPVPPAPPRGKKSSLLARLFVLLIVLALAAGGVLGAALWWLPRQPLQLAQPVEFTIARGMTLRQAVEAMSRAGIPFQPELLYWAARLNRQGNHIIAGSYVAESGLSPLALVRMMEQGQVATASVRLGEGWTLRQIRAALRQAPYLVDDISALDEATLLARIGAEEK